MCVAGIMASAILFVPGPAGATPAVEYTNPIAAQRADPHIFKHTDGYYYFTATVPAYDRIVLRRATTLQGLATATETTIWQKHASGDMGAHIWAPEIHFINGKWYIYFAAAPANDQWRIRMWVLENSSADPFTGTWTERGRITTPWDTFSLDASTFTVGGVRYLTWAQSEPGISTNSNVYLAKMGADPWTITGATTRLTVPTLSWETVGYKVNEGPAVVEHDGKVFLTYSASATDSNYCLGMLTASSSADLLNAASWTKSQTPVFTSNSTTGQYGPGHNSFVKSEDGLSDILVYHDRDYANITGDPLNDPNRRTRIQKVYWNSDGTPNFGVPVADGVTPVRLKSLNFPDRFVRHYNFQARIDPNVTPLADSQFQVVPGLSGTGTVSLQSVNYPGYYLRQSSFLARVDKNDGSAGFAADASFTKRPGLAQSTAVSLESVSNPNYYLRHQNYVLRLDPKSTAGTYPADATFILE